MKRKRYEYDVVTMPHDISSIQSALKLVDELNKRGKQGWHAIAELPGQVVLIEREKINAPNR